MYQAFPDWEPHPNLMHTYRHRYQDNTYLTILVDLSGPKPSLRCLNNISPANIVEHRRWLHEVIMPDIEAAHRAAAVKVTA